MALELKSGPMLWHKRRFFGSNWRDVHSVLYNDSSLLWYKDRSLEEQEGGVVLKEAPELIAFGPYTAAVPDRPSLPDNYEQKQLLAFGVRGKDLVYWFLCPNEAEVASWMAAITSAMPAPPAPPMPLQQPPEMATAPDGAAQFQPQQMPPSQYVPPSQPPPQYTPAPQPQQMSAYGPPQPSPAIPGQYPTRMGYRPPPYQPGYNSVHPQPYTTPNAAGTTVVVQQDRQGGYIGGGGGGGDFAMGMLMGGALGTVWGSSHHHWGHGPGYGGGWGGGGGPQIHDTDVTINNYYDNDTSVVNNNLDMTNNLAIEQEAPETDDVIMGDMVPLDDGGGLFDGGGDFDGDFGGGDFGGGDFGGDF